MPIRSGPGSSGAQTFATSAELDALDVSLDAHTADSTGVHGIADTAALVTTTAANAAYVAEGAAFSDIAKYAGVDSTGVNECAAAINTALDAIAAAGRRAYARGTFKIASTVTFAANADFADATFNYTAGSGVAVQVGTATSGSEIERIDVHLPRVDATLNATGEGWSDTANVVAVDVVNLYSSRVTIPHVQGAGVGVRVRGVGTGCVHNQFTLGHLDNNKTNLQLTADSTGWCNENLFLGGRLSHESAEGTDVVGTRQVALTVCTNPVNNNVFLQPSIEGDVAEFHAEIAGSYNRIIQGRWEASTPKVRWLADADTNVVDGGYNSGSIAQTIVSGALRNDVWGHLRHTHTRSGGTSGVTVLENTGSSTYPTDVIMDPGAQVAGSAPATAYRVARGADSTHMKRATDAQPRITLDHTNGRVYLGDGTNAADAYFRGGQTYLAPIGHLWWLTNNTHDLGSRSGPYMPRDLAVGRNAYIAGELEVDGALNHDGSTVGFYGTTPAAKPTVTGSRGANAALASLITALAGLGLVTDSSSA